MFVDYHVHTEFSDDSDYPMENVVKDAIRLGLDEICFTDHVDYGVKVDWDSGKEILYRDGSPLANVDYPRYVEKIQELQRSYKGQIRIKQGLEFGMQRHTIPEFAALFDRYPFDFILHGSAIRQTLFPGSGRSGLDGCLQPALCGTQ
ncbi:MAG: PHP domain-containing protein, partial [Lachnospiraceae bacterium]|nr:PHP domain-containing protein [Lachnospiraceae bacterium]